MQLPPIHILNDLAKRLPEVNNAWIAAVVFLFSLLVFTQMSNNLIQKVYFPTGDEPYYLLMAHSLIHDGDLELTNNFDHQDYWPYYPGELYPRHESITTRPGLWSKHSPGVALLIVPGYAWLDWRGAAYTINLLAALLAANLYLLGYEVSGRKLVGLFTWAALAFTNPLASYAPLIFPATPAALFTIYAYRQIRFHVPGFTFHAGKATVERPFQAATGRLEACPADSQPTDTGRLKACPTDSQIEWDGGTWRLLLAALCIAALPWLNAQLLPIALGLFVYALSKLLAPAAPGDPAAWRRIWQSVASRRMVTFLTPLLVSGLLFLGYYYFLYESFLPNWHDHAGSSSLPETFIGLVGSFLDQQWGLLIHAPLLILGFAGLLVMAQRRQRELAWLAVIGLPYFLVIINYKQWWGEWCPAARYLVPLVPLLAAPMAYAVSALRRWWFALFYSPLVIASGLVMAAFVIKPRLMYNHPVGQSSLLLWWVEQGGPDLTRIVPTFFIAEEIERNLALAGVWAVVAGAIMLLAWRGAVQRE